MRNDFESNYLMHHGILGQKWGIRNYQNPDGSLTEAGRKRYGVGPGRGVSDINTDAGIKKRTKDLKKAIKKNEKARGKEYTKIANNPENFLGRNKKHAKKIEEYSEQIKKGEEELNRLKDKLNNQKVITDGADVDRLAQEAAKKAGLDQGDNWKVYRDAQRGDTKAQEVVNKWESDKAMSSSKESKSLNDGFGKLKGTEWEDYYRKDEIDNVSSSKQKVGGEDVDFTIKNYRWDSNDRQYKQAVSQDEAVSQAQKFLKDFNVEKAKESIAKKYYDKWAAEYKEQGVSRNQFKAALEPYSVDIDPMENGGSYYVCFDDGGLVGGHSLDIEGDLNDMKIKYHSMNG